MEIRFMGHAALRINGAQPNAGLVDPWFSKTGAFFRSWFQFPENHPLLDEALHDVGDILISHNHEDHFDPPVLREALKRNPHVRLHIAAFATDWFKRRIERELGALGDKLVVHKPFEDFELACGAKAFFVPEESPGQIDSAIVFHDHVHFFVNMNDARLNTAQLEKIASLTKHVDFLALQASGASEYPINYLYDADDMAKRKAEKRQLKLEHCERVVDIFKPKRILFFAGPPVFLDPALEAHNDLSKASVFPDQKDILDHYSESRSDIADASYFLLPGDQFSDEFLWSTVDLNSERTSPFTKKVAYVKAYREQRQTELDFDLGEMPDLGALLKHFQAMATVSSYVAKRIGGKLCFLIQSKNAKETFTVDFDRQEASRGLAEDPLYVLTAPARALSSVLKNDTTWDDVFLSIRMSFDEKTDRFISHFKTLLKYMDHEMMAALENYEMSLSENETEMFDVVCGGKTHRIQRHCPHAGVDLKQQGKVNDDGTITCMAHRFCFDLGTGKCTNTEGFQLKVE